MIIDKPSSTHIPTLRQLWKTAFGDSDGFLDDFWQTAYAPDRCRCVFLQNTPVSALYWFPTCFQGRPGAYLYAVATDPAHRCKGYASALLRDTHAHMKAIGLKDVFLLPQEDSLRTYYEKAGYRTCCRVHEFTCPAAKTPVALRQIDAATYAALRRQYLPEHGVLQEGVTLSFLDSQGVFFAGEDFVLFAYPEQPEIQVKELLGNADAAPGIVRAFGAQSGHFRIPGDSLAFAMRCVLDNADETQPAYLGLALD